MPGGEPQTLSEGAEKGAAEAGIVERLHDPERHAVRLGLPEHGGVVSTVGQPEQGHDVGLAGPLLEHDVEQGEDGPGRATAERRGVAHGHGGDRPTFAGEPALPRQQLGEPLGREALEGHADSLARG